MWELADHWAWQKLILGIITDIKDGYNLVTSHTSQQVYILVSKTRHCVYVLAMPCTIIIYSYCSDIAFNNAKHKHTLTALTSLACLVGP